MTVNVRTLSGKPNDLGISFYLNPETNPTPIAKDLKELIAVSNDVSIDTIKLLFEGRILKDDDTLSSKGVTDGSSILMLKGRLKTKKPDEVIIEDVKEDQQYQLPEISEEEKVRKFQEAMSKNPEAFMSNLMNNPLISRIAGQDKEIFIKMLKDPNFIKNVVSTGEGGVSNKIKNETENMKDTQEKDN
jgi:uncharacterized ubiquitin-like protein YukD